MVLVCPLQHVSRMVELLLPMGTTQDGFEVAGLGMGMLYEQVEAI